MLSIVYYINKQTTEDSFKKTYTSAVKILSNVFNVKFRFKQILKQYNYNGLHALKNLLYHVHSSVGHEEH